MAQEVVTVLWDDFNRSVQGDETIQFSFEGTSYVIDLTEKNAVKFRKVMAPYIEAGRVDQPVKAPSKPKSIAPPKAAKSKQLRGGERDPNETKTDRDAMRKWARNNGFDIGTNGQISREIRAAYMKWRPAGKGVAALVGVKS